MTIRTDAPLVVWLALACAIWLLCAHLPAAQPPEPGPGEADSLERDYAEELPRIAPLDPDEALQSFELLPGFRIELAASEPNVVDPVAMDFDEDGRLYVVEMRGYSENPDDALSRVRLLEDRDDDGFYETSHVFVEGLSWPTAIICYAGGVFVGDAPEIFFARDDDGDGRADHRVTVFTGFGKSNVQGLLNSFRFGLDNRIHGATSSSGAEVRTVATPADLWATSPATSSTEDEPATPVLTLRGRDFAFDPRTLHIEATSGGAQHGLSFDDWGRKFVCHNSDHIQQVMFEDRYMARNPFLATPAARRSIAADGPQAEVFRISPVEPWRIVRTRLRKQGIVPGPVEGGGRAAGYFTGATGATIYRGDTLPEAMRGNVFVGDVGSNIVHRKRLVGDGVELTAERADEGVEFIASRDIWFRPAQFAHGPDGALWILDVYREVIEHPLSLHPVIKQHLDLNSGRDRGRLYRVAPESHERRNLPGLSQATTAQLVALLEHPNGWHIDTAARLLYERQDQAAMAALKNLAQTSSSPVGRVRALYALSGLDALDEQTVLAALADSHPRVCEHAVRLCETLRAPSDAVLQELASRTSDGDERVRYQLAFTLGAFRGERRDAALAKLLRRDAANRWIRLAVLSSLGDGAEGVLARLIEDAGWRATSAAGKVLPELARQVGLAGQDEAVDTLVAHAVDLPEDDLQLAQAIVLELCEGLAGSGQPVAGVLDQPGREEIRKLVAPVLTAAQQRAGNPEQSESVRREAIATLALLPYDEVAALLGALLDSREPQSVQLAAMATLSRYAQREAAELLLAAWPTMTPRVRAEATEALFRRTGWLLALLDAIDDGRLASNDLVPARWAQIREHGHAQVRQRGEQLLASAEPARRQDVVAAYQPALSMTGDVDRGRTLFRKECAACHKLEGHGHELGPNLATLQNRGPEAILVNVLDPNREANPQYVNYVLITEDGRSISGMLTSETATSVTLTRAEAVADTVLRLDIDELRSTSLSLMPEGLEQRIDAQGMADLIAYLLSLE